jgi:hypothetical protein
MAASVAPSDSIARRAKVHGPIWRSDTSLPRHRTRQRYLTLLLCLLVWQPGAIAALSLSKKSVTNPAPGVTVERYATTNPKTNVWLAKVDLCSSGIHVDASRAPKTLQSPASWGAARGAKLATNGDFYKTGPVRVYGDAVGEGVRWPQIQTGLSAAYQNEWYWQDAGWIAFLHDGVEFSHTGWQKKNGKKLEAGWSPSQFTDKLPAGVLALVGGFPELVVEGKVYSCSSPTASTCFPDRSDMRARHPRTAMGLTSDNKTFLLVVVDGRTTASIGMYGTELAELMGKLGAWEAFNLDGGGSSQMWVAGKGTVNDAKGNNNGGGLRAVANHWGILAGVTAGYPTRPGHCEGTPACATIAAAGATLQETSPCFRTFGPPEYWRTEKVGQAGGLRWTNAGNSGVPDNWAWWRLELAEAGTYKVETAAHASFGVFAKTHYEVRAAGKSINLNVNQSKSTKGWIELGSYAFVAGGKQWVAVLDDHQGAPVKEQPIVADALRLTRVEPWCGSGVCGGGETCATCPQDCGACPPICGDASCDGGETCATCSADCGACDVPDAGPTDVMSSDAGASEPDSSALDSTTVDADVDDKNTAEAGGGDTLLLPDLGPIDLDASDAEDTSWLDGVVGYDGVALADATSLDVDAAGEPADVWGHQGRAVASGCSSSGRQPASVPQLGLLLLCWATLGLRRLWRTPTPSTSGRDL